MPAIRLIVHGRVQGVSYRKWTVSTASAKGLSGWVRNRRDGTVEMVLSGEEATLADMQNACKKGPVLARVDKVEASPWEESVTAGFSQHETV